MPQVTGDAYDFAPGIVRVLSDLLADRGLRVPPILKGEILGYDCHSPALVNLGPGEFAPGAQWGPEGMKGARRRSDEMAQRRNLVSRIGMIAGEYRVLRHKPGHGQTVHNA